MNIPRKVLNGFTATEVRQITNLSVHMIDYLAREGYLTPTYGQGRVRGKVRYYSYRDVLIAKIVAKLLESGIELRRLKKSIRLLSEDRTWFHPSKRSFDLLATDGRQLYYHDRSDSLVELTTGRQRTFSFVLDVTRTKNDLKQQIDSAKRRLFAIENRPLIYATPAARRTKRNSST